LLFRLTREDWKIILYHLGKMLHLLSLVFLLPLVPALFYRELDTLPYFLLTSGLTLLLATLLSRSCRTEESMELKHALCLVALAWLSASLLASLPLWLGKACASPLDACFESLSGFTGTGLSLATDPDHLARSVHFHRHLLQFLGDGVGIVAVSLAVLGRTEISSALAFRGEAREEGIRPSVVRTTRLIFGMAFTFFVVGAAMFTLAGLYEGADLRTALFDGICHSFTGYATGGFSPHSQNLMYYHGMVYEIAAMVLAVIGALNFNLHYALLTGKRGEVFRNTEARVFFLTTLLLGTFTALLLFSRGIYTSTEALFRRGVFQLVSAQTTTGFFTVPPLHLALLWPLSLLFLLSLAMLLGGCANSTSGGIKSLRVGILLKSLALELRRPFLPRSAVVGERFHHLRDSPLTPSLVRGAAVVATSYLLLFVAGSFLTMAYGYGAEQSMFETSSALSNVGLSCGITSPSMPSGLKVTYMLLMWMGRLEVITVLVLLIALALGLQRRRME
jgi:trk system potassium uptake protein TrkH